MIDQLFADAARLFVLLLPAYVLVRVIVYAIQRRRQAQPRRRRRGKRP